MHRNKLTVCSIALSAVLVAGCASRSPEPPPSAELCPKPAPLPAWVIEAANGPSSTELLDKIIEPYGTP